MLSFMKHMGAHEQPGTLERLLTPSWLSGLLAVVIATAAVLGTLGYIYYQGSAIHVWVVNNAHHMSPSSTDYSDYESVDTSLSTHTVVSDIPLFIFWAGVGVVAYYFTMTAVGALRSAAELREEMHYAHVSRNSVLKQAVERLGLRLGALVLWFFYLYYTLHLIVPYTIALAYAGTTSAGGHLGPLYVLGAILVLAVTGHLHAIFLRLVALRPRL